MPTKNRKQRLGASIGPFRAVVGAFQDEYGVLKERLSCGHAQSVKQGIYGPTNAYRRNCRQCRMVEQSVRRSELGG